MNSTQKDWFTEVVNLQEKFMGVLIAKGALAPIKVISQNLDSKESQSLIRELVGYFVEELVEASTLYTEITEDLRLNPIERVYLTNPAKSEKVLMDFNMELTDALCFALEIFLYTGCTLTGLKNHIDNQYENLTQKQFIQEGNISLGNKLCMLANLANIRWGIYSTGKNQEYPWLISETPYTKAGRRLNLNYTDKNFSYLIIEDLYRAMFLLKNKPWRDNAPPPQESVLKENIYAFLVSFFQLLDLYGADSESIYLNFLKKYEENQKRQEKGY